MADVAFELMFERARSHREKGQVLAGYIREELGNVPRWLRKGIAERAENQRVQPKGFEKLPRKQLSLSKLFSRAERLGICLTRRQRDCFSLTLEYGLSVSEVARRLEIHRKTVYGHLKAASRKLRDPRVFPFLKPFLRKSSL